MVYRYRRVRAGRGRLVIGVVLSVLVLGYAVRALGVNVGFGFGDDRPPIVPHARFDRDPTGPPESTAPPLPPVDPAGLLARAHELARTAHGVHASQQQRAGDIQADVDMDPAGGLAGELTGHRPSGVILLLDIVVIGENCWINDLGWTRTCDTGVSDLRTLLTLPEITALVDPARFGPPTITTPGADTVTLAGQAGTRVTIERASGLLREVQTGLVTVELSEWDKPVTITAPHVD